MEGGFVMNNFLLVRRFEIHIGQDERKEIQIADLRFISGKFMWTQVNSSVDTKEKISVEVVVWVYFASHVNDIYVKKAVDKLRVFAPSLQKSRNSHPDIFFKRDVLKINTFFIEDLLWLFLEVKNNAAAWKAVIKH